MLSAPSNLTAVTVSSTSIRLNWADVNTRVSSFAIERSLSATTGFVVIATVDDALRSYTNSGLSSGRYYYRVRAQWRDRVSTPSNVANAVIAAASDTTPPSVPTGVQASVASCTQTNVWWSASQDTGGSGLQGYKVYRNGVYVKHVYAPATYAADAGLQASTSYSYMVRAVDMVGNQSGNSVTIWATTSSCGGATRTATRTPTRTPTPGGGATRTATRTPTRTATPVPTSTPGLLPGATGTYQWGKRFGGSSTDVFAATAVDKRANCDGVGGTNCIVAAGRFMGTASVGGGLLTSAGSEDLLVAKYTASGGHLWSRRFGGTGTDRGFAVAVDPSGNVLVAGVSTATADFGGGALPGAGGADVIVAKYAGSDGAHLWSKRLGGPGADFGFGVAVDASGNVVVIGSFEPPVAFGGGPLTNQYGIVTDMFVAKYAANGAYLWARNFYNTSEAMGKAVAVDASGNVVVTGYFKGTMNMGGGNMSNPSAWGNVFVGKLSASGTYLWQGNWGNVDFNDVGNGIAVDRSGNVVVTGFCQGPGNFGGAVLQADTAGDMFVAKYAGTNGAHLWSRRGGTASYADAGTSVTTDGSDNVTVTGSFQRTADIGGPSLVSHGGLDVFVAKYAAANGSPVWSKAVGGVANDEGFGVSTDAGGNVIVTGYIADLVNLGGGPLVSLGGIDGFVLKLAP